jgi:hypothetical protein
VCSVIHFLGAKKVPPFEIHCELVTVNGGNVMAVNNVHKWCKEFESGRVNVKDEQRSGQPSTAADPVQDFDAAVQTDV